MARRAGIWQASRATRIKINGAPAIVTGSVRRHSDQLRLQNAIHSERCDQAENQAQSLPAHMPSRRTILRISSAAAPIAMRTPISFVR